MAIRVGLVGAGCSGRAHLACLAKTEEAQVVAVCDTDRRRAEDAAALFGATAHINFRTLLEAQRLDAVFVCTPPFARGELEIAAARAGVHLFVDPPVALNPEKARQIQKEIEKSGVVASVGFLWRYLSGMDQAQELLKAHKPALVRGTHMALLPPPGWRRKTETTGGLPALLAGDLIDAARCLAGEMAAIGAVQFQGATAAREPDCDLEDAVAAVARFQSGVAGEFLTSIISPRHELSLTLLADQFELRLTETEIEVVEAGRRAAVEHTGSALQKAQEAFLKAVHGGHAQGVRATYADAVRCLEVAVGARTAAQTGRMVSL